MQDPLAGDGDTVDPLDGGDGMENPPAGGDDVVDPLDDGGGTEDPLAGGGGTVDPPGRTREMVDSMSPRAWASSA